MNMKIRKGDRVMVVRGSAEDKGKIGEVIRVEPDKMRVVVQGVNIRKKHQKQTQSHGRTIPSGIIEFEGPIHVSNVVLINPKDNKPTKIKIERKDGKRIRVSKRTGDKIDKGQSGGEK
jgi:large subunit ribosomal protein L24